MHNRKVIHHDCDMFMQNERGIKFGLVVNDMAQVNVDSKLIQSQIQGFEGRIFVVNGIDSYFRFTSWAFFTRH